MKNESFLKWELELSNHATGDIYIKICYRA